MNQFKFTFFTGLLFLWFLNCYGQSSVIVPPGTNVTVGTGTTLDIGGEKLLLQDDFSSAPSFLQYGSLTFSGGGKAFVEQYLPIDMYHIVSSPIQNEVNGAYLWIYLFDWDEPTYTFTDIYQPLDIPLNVGEGYFAWTYVIDPNGLWPASPDSVVLDGTLNFSDAALSLDYSSVYADSAGWNLLGNPFPVAIDWNGHADWNLNNVGYSVYLWDGANTQYMTYNWNTGLGTNGKTNGHIAATQGFWVKTIATGASLTIPASQRLHSNESFYKESSKISENLLRINVEGNNHSDETLICFYEDATGAFDYQFDALYKKSKVEVPFLYTITEGKKYAMNFLPSVEKYQHIPLHFTASVPDIYSLTVTGIESFTVGQPLYLEDKQDKNFQDLREQPVYFFASTPSDNYDRFVIHFAKPASMDNKMDNVHIFSWYKTVFVDIPFEVEGEVFVFDITGRKIINEKAHTGLNELYLPHSKGNYIVKLLTNTGMVSKKIHIN